MAFATYIKEVIMKKVAVISVVVVLILLFVSGCNKELIAVSGTGTLANLFISGDIGINSISGAELTLQKQDAYSIFTIVLPRTLIDGILSIGVKGGDVVENTEKNLSNNVSICTDYENGQISGYKLLGSGYVEGDIIQFISKYQPALSIGECRKLKDIKMFPVEVKASTPISYVAFEVTPKDNLLSVIKGDFFQSANLDIRLRDESTIIIAMENAIITPIENNVALAPSAILQKSQGKNVKNVFIRKDSVSFSDKDGVKTYSLTKEQREQVKIALFTTPPAEKKVSSWGFLKGAPK